MKKMSLILAAIVSMIASMITPAASAQEIIPGSSMPVIQLPQLPVIQLPQLPDLSSSAPAPAPLPAPVRDIGAEQAYWQDYNFNEVNAIRAQHGLHPLAYDAGLQYDAITWSNTMNNGGFLDHDYDGVYAKNQAENVYRGYGDTPANANPMFMDSSSHRANILDPYLTRLGVGVSYNSYEGIWYLTQRFV